MGRQTILNKIAQFILTGGRRTTAAGTRDVLNEMAYTYVSCIYDTAANFTANNPILETKQIGVETNDLTTAPKFKIGDGVTAWNSLPYANSTSGGTWGTITGTLSNQTDLQTALNAKEDTSNKTSTVTGNESSTSKYPNVKAVYDWVTGLFVKKGTLTANTIPKATASDTIGDSSITDNGSQVTVNNDFYVNSGGAEVAAQGNIAYISADQQSNTNIESNLTENILLHNIQNTFDAPLSNFPHLTASQIVATDASKNLVSIPFGTTAGTVLEGDKILDLRQIYKSLRITQDSSTITGTTSETILSSVLIPANTFSVNDVINLEIRCKRASATSTTSHRIRVNTSNSLSGATLIAIVQNNNTVLMPTFSRNLVIKSSTNTEVMGTSATFSTDVGSITSAVSSLNINWTIDQYIIISVQPSASAETNILSYLLIERR